MPQKGISNNPSGRPKGIVNKRVQEWEALAQSITEHQAPAFNSFLMELWSSPDVKDKMRAAQLYLQVLEYFKPKLARHSTSIEQTEPLEIRVQNDI